MDAGMLMIGFLAMVSLTGEARGAPQAMVAGFAELRIDDGEQRALSGYIFYPGQGGVSALRVGENAVRQGFDVFPNAPLADGRFPLVVLSHGLMGHALNQGWLAVRLAAKGYVVATVHHPGSSFLDRDPEQRRALWERPRDVSRTTSAMLAHPEFGDRILADRIVVVGHSLGGYDVAALAGARLDIDIHIAYCRENENAADCQFARMAALHEPDADRKRLEADLHDPRIKAGVTLDLGLVQAMDRKSLSAVTTPLLVIGAGRTPDVLDVEMESRVFADTLPSPIVRYIEHADLGHYDALDLCKPEGYAILMEDEPESAHICEMAGEERQRHHEWLAAEILAFFTDLGMTVR
ncbi:MAG: hypothetical protein HC869_07175 [Rhodospirillales bacterium]|nr:hypothetical protein [Rhodospirillales bacterium]